MLNLKKHINLQAEYRHPIGLAVFRILFGLVSLVSAIRFWMKGWIEEFYIKPGFFFKYYGFEWVEAAPPAVLYSLYALMIICCIGIMLGWYYRAAAIGYFLLFTYFELLDKTYYLNHYYFISIIAFLLIFLPASSYLSVDVLRNKTRPSLIRGWHVNVLRLQLGILYFYAGIAKLNPEWLFNAMPMQIWLQEFSSTPVLGPFLTTPFAAYGASYFGLLYDCTLPFFLCFRNTRAWAYAAVIIFHLATSALFPIGMFPYIMIGATLIFFPGSAFKKIRRKVARFAPAIFIRIKGTQKKSSAGRPAFSGTLPVILTAHFIFQLIFPFRYLAYPGNLFWHEQGFRFSWRVMLMEKSGFAEFRVVSADGQKEWHIINADYLTPAQEKMMSTQPDFITQYAHFLCETFRARGVADPKVYGDVFVTLNGRRSERYIDPATDLAGTNDSWAHKQWILPSPQETKFVSISAKR